MENKSGNIYEALALAMTKVGVIAKGRRNQEQGYAFRGIDDVYNELHDVLSEAGVFTTCEVLETSYADITTAKGSKMTEVRIKARWSFWAKDGSRLTHDTVGLGRDSGDKAANKAMSVGHKYALIQVLCIPTEDTKDPENDHSPAKPAPSASQLYQPDVAIKQMEEAKNEAAVKVIYAREYKRRNKYSAESWAKIEATKDARKAELGKGAK